MNLVGFQGDQIQILMKMKITSERGGKEVRRGTYLSSHVSNMTTFYCLLFTFNLINSSVNSDLGSFLSGIPAVHVCMTVLTYIVFSRVFSFELLDHFLTCVAWRLRGYLLKYVPQFPYPQHNHIDLLSVAGCEFVRH